MVLVESDARDLNRATDIVSKKGAYRLINASCAMAWTKSYTCRRNEERATALSCVPSRICEYTNCRWAFRSRGLIVSFFRYLKIGWRENMIGKGLFASIISTEIPFFNCFNPSVAVCWWRRCSMRFSRCCIFWFCVSGRTSFRNWSNARFLKNIINLLVETEVVDWKLSEAKAKTKNSVAG